MDYSSFILTTYEHVTMIFRNLDLCSSMMESAKDMRILGKVPLQQTKYREPRGGYVRQG